MLSPRGGGRGLLATYGKLAWQASLLVGILTLRCCPCMGWQFDMAAILEDKENLDMSLCHLGNTQKFHVLPLSLCPTELMSPSGTVTFMSCCKHYLKAT